MIRITPRVERKYNKYTRRFSAFSLSVTIPDLCAILLAPLPIYYNQCSFLMVINLERGFGADLLDRGLELDFDTSTPSYLVVA